VNDSVSGLSELDRNALRALVAEIEVEVSDLVSRSAAGTPADRAHVLAGSWARLTKLIALEPEPELRTCPHCQRRVMRSATRCLHCWRRSDATPSGLP
jgi:hypothetical protein